MLSLKKLRELNPELKDKSDEEVSDIRERLYEMAELALECYFEKKKGNL